MKTTSYTYTIGELPIDHINGDPEQPRQDFGTENDANRLLLSIKKYGLGTPIVVSEVAKDNYLVIEGHRRHICAKKLGFETVRCQIYPKLSKKDLEILRYELQNNRRPWKPIERSEALQKIKDSAGFTTNKELASHVHASETAISLSLQLLKQKKRYVDLMEKYELPESYRGEFIRLRPKIRDIKEFKIDEIIENIFRRIRHQVIRSSKELRKLGRIFLRATANEEKLYEYLSDPDMTVTQLDQETVQTGYSLLIEQLSQKTAEKRQKGIALSSQEKESLVQFAKLINEIYELH